MKPDYALYVIKPDGVFLGIHDILLNEISRRGYVVLREKECVLPGNIVTYLFNTGAYEAEYAAYMSGGCVIAGICMGVDAYEWLTRLKYDIRKAFGKQNSMCNLLHTCEPGLEHMRQMDYFFPEWHSMGWHQTVDMYIPISARDAYERIRQIEGTNIEYVGLILGDDIDSASLCEPAGVKTYWGIQLNAKWNADSCVNEGIASHASWQANRHQAASQSDDSLPVLLYFRNIADALKARMLSRSSCTKIATYAHQTGAIPIAGFFEYEPFRRDMIIAAKWTSGVYLYDPRYSYNELNTVEHWAVAKAAMPAIGGSYGIYQPGWFGVPTSYAQRIFGCASNE